jgi:hypothetical protein
MAPSCAPRVHTARPALGSTFSRTSISTLQATSCTTTPRAAVDGGALAAAGPAGSCAEAGCGGGGAAGELANRSIWASQRRRLQWSMSVGHRLRAGASPSCGVVAAGVPIRAESDCHHHRRWCPEGKKWRAQAPVPVPAPGGSDLATARWLHSGRRRARARGPVPAADPARLQQRRRRARRPSTPRAPCRPSPRPAAQATGP